jgi:hypothetical protein
VRFELLESELHSPDRRGSACVHERRFASYLQRP